MRPLHLADDRSALDGLPIRGSKGLRVVVTGHAGLPWLLSCLALALACLLLGGGGLYWMNRPQRRFRDVLRARIADLEEADRRLRAEVAEHAQAQRQLDLEIAFRRDIEDSVNVGLRVVDLSGGLTAVNRAFCELSGWSKGQLLDARPVAGLRALRNLCRELGVAIERRA